MNDLDAVIESGQALYVPVEGAFDSDLFKVQSGTVLRVTPHVIQNEFETEIRLLINVEDGTVDITSDENGNSVPMSTRNSVITQAIVQSGTSLLLGGLVREQASTVVQKVPLLGDIPLVGRLFRNNVDENQRTERMYLISPRIISAQGASEKAAKKLEEMKFGSFEENKAKLDRMRMESSQSSTDLCEGECNASITDRRLRIF